MRHFLIPAVAICTLLMSCDLIEYHPYDVSLSRKYSDLNQKSIDRILSKKPDNDTVRFILMGDTQRSYDETVDFVKAVNRRDNIDFIIHGGDITDFGMTKEYIWIHDIMSKLRFPYVAIIGNHDILGHGKEVYKSIYGDYNFSFIYNDTKFIFLNTNALEFDYSTPIPDYNFIRNELGKDNSGYSQTIIAMHVQPFDLEFNNNTAHYFQDLIRQFKNPLCALHAHAHMLMQNDLFNDGLLYIGCDDLHDRNYLLFTVTKGKFSYEVVYF